MKKLRKTLYWTPRILGILFAVFISLFALDVFAEGYAWYEIIVALFMHLVPTYLALIALFIAWKWEMPGGIIYIILGLLFIILARYADLITWLIIAGPVILTGILFILSAKFKYKK